MPIPRRLQSWLSWFLSYRHGAREADLKRELRDHLELEAESGRAVAARGGPCCAPGHWAPWKRTSAVRWTVSFCGPKEATQNAAQTWWGVAGLPLECAHGGRAPGECCPSPGNRFTTWSSGGPSGGWNGCQTWLKRGRPAEPPLGPVLDSYLRLRLRHPTRCSRNELCYPRRELEHRTYAHGFRPSRVREPQPLQLRREPVSRRRKISSRPYVLCHSDRLWRECRCSTISRQPAEL
jgi:hypothetical protein